MSKDMKAKDTVMSDEEIKKLTGHTTTYEPKDTQISYSLKSIGVVVKAQAEISFKAGIKEGIRRAYQCMKDCHYAIDFDLDKATEYLEEKYANKSRETTE